MSWSTLPHLHYQMICPGTAAHWWGPCSKIFSPLTLQTRGAVSILLMGKAPHPILAAEPFLGTVQDSSAWSEAIPCQELF